MALRTSRRSGTTLIEILLVTAILVIMGGALVIALRSFYGDVRVKAAADKVQEAWSEARSKAIEEGVPYRFAVQAGTGKYRLAPDSEENWEGTEGGSEGELPSSIMFGAGSWMTETTGGWSTVAVFNADGSCQEDCEISLRDDEEYVMVIRVRAMTGAITVRRGTGGN